jgi:hypothetical protein
MKLTIKKIKSNASDLIYTAKTNINTNQQNKAMDRYMSHKAAIKREEESPSQYAALQKSVSKAQMKVEMDRVQKLQEKQKKTNKKHGY